MTRQEILAVAKPILFNTDMVRAILEGRKTATRRVIKPQPCNGNGTIRFERWFHRDHYTTLARFGDDVSVALCDRKPPYRPGDYLYVRETWCTLPVTPGGHMRGHDVYYYKADEDLRPDAWKGNWHPSIHMPKEAARIFLRVTGVQAEKLQELNGNDVEKEGIKTRITHFKNPINNFGNADRFREAVKEFSSLWNSTIKPADLPICGWDANPWVFVLEFERVMPKEVH